MLYLSWGTFCIYYQILPLKPDGYTENDYRNLEKQTQLSFQSATEIRKQVIRGKQSFPLLWLHFLHSAGSQAGGSAAVHQPVVTGWIPGLEHFSGDPGSVMHSDL